MLVTAPVAVLEKADLQNWQGVTVAMCNSCEHVSISLEGLDDLMTRKKLKNIVVDEIISRREVLSEEEFRKTQKLELKDIRRSCLGAGFFLS